VAVDDPVVALADGGRLHVGEVAAGARLREALAPDLVGGEQRREIASLLLVRAVHEDGRRRHAETDHVDHERHVGAGHLLAGDRLEALVAVAAVLLRIVRADQPGAVALLLPATEIFPLLLARYFDRVDGHAEVGGGGTILGEPAAAVLAELRLFFAVATFGHPICLA
jgi:hypothetical protein